jgi:hypothetical protein
MFLWVKLIIDSLYKSSTKLEIKERLRSLPRGLKNGCQFIFSHLVDELDDFELTLAKWVLALTTASFRTLEIEELRYAYALGIECSSLLNEHLLLQPVRRILDILGGLVSIKDGHIQLIHFSLEEFLIRPENK